MGKKGHTKNRYEVLDSETAVIYLRKKSGEEIATYISAIDLEAVLNKGRWVNNNSGYAMLAGGCGLTLHRFIMDTPKGLQTDHIDGDRLNNRRSNLRIVTAAQNQQNKYRKNRTLPRGVYFNKKEKKYYVYCCVNYKHYHGGIYATVEAAENAAINLRAKLFSHNAERK